MLNLEPELLNPGLSGVLIMEDVPIDLTEVLVAIYNNYLNIKGGFDDFSVYLSVWPGKTQMLP